MLIKKDQATTNAFESVTEIANLVSQFQKQQSRMELSNAEFNEYLNQFMECTLEALADSEPTSESLAVSF